MRVNLLRKSEVRYQGAVSRRFLLTTVVTTILLIILLVSVILCMGWQARRAKKKRLSQRLEELTPIVSRVQANQSIAAHNAKILAALNEWKEKRVVWNAVLNDIQFQVPESVQLSSLQLVAVKPAQATSWKNRMSLSGIARSSQPEDVVVRFRRSLLKAESLGACYSSVKLVSFNRTTDKEEGGERAVFSILGEGEIK
jgi:Tfp pilus assembly protein PilN